MVDGDIVLACDGATVLGVGRVNGPYRYSPAQEFPHERSVQWLDLSEWRIPTLEGLRTTVHEYRKHFDNWVAIERLMLESTPQPHIKTSDDSVADGIGTPKRAAWVDGGTVGRIQDLLNRKGQAILYGPPGTGKTYWAEKAVQNLASLWNVGVNFEDLSGQQRERVVGHQPDAFVRACTFHSSYGYEDFIEGFRPETADGNLSFAIREGIDAETELRSAATESCGRDRRCQVSRLVGAEPAAQDVVSTECIRLGSPALPVRGDSVRDCKLRRKRSPDRGLGPGSRRRPCPGRLASRVSASPCGTRGPRADCGQ